MLPPRPKGQGLRAVERMTIRPGSDPVSTVYFCMKRLGIDSAWEVAEHYESDCLKPKNWPKYAALAHQGKYNEVLGAIWRDRTENCLAFVRSLKDELHAPLMFEAAILEFTASPTAKTVQEVCLPLLFAAHSRVIQDLACLENPLPYKGDVEIMAWIYRTSLMNAIEKKRQDPSSEISKYSSSKEVINESPKSSLEKVREKLLVTARLSKQIQLPPPDWMAQYRTHHSIYRQGENDLICRPLAHPSSDHAAMLPASSYKTQRDAYADLAIKELGGTPS